MYIHIYVCIRIHWHVDTALLWSECIRILMYYVYTYIYMWIYIYVCIYTYIHTYICIHIQSRRYCTTVECLYMYAYIYTYIQTASSQLSPTQIKSFRRTFCFDKNIPPASCRVRGRYSGHGDGGSVRKGRRGRRDHTRRRIMRLEIFLKKSDPQSKWLQKTRQWVYIYMSVYMIYTSIHIDRGGGIGGGWGGGVATRGRGVWDWCYMFTYLYMYIDIYICIRIHYYVDTALRGRGVWDWCYIFTYLYMYIDIYIWICIHCDDDMGWLRLVGSLKL